MVEKFLAHTFHYPESYRKAQAIFNTVFFTVLHGIDEYCIVAENGMTALRFFSDAFKVVRII